MKLPNSSKAAIPREKIEAYLFSPVHSIGRHKAAFFNTLGYTPAEWKVLEWDLRGLLVGDAPERK